MFAQMVNMMAGMDHSHMFDTDEMINGLNLGLLIIRVVVGVTLATHGLNKIFGGGKIAGTAGWFASMGMKMPKANAWIAALTEIGSGALLALGLLTPLAAAGMVAIMVVALITTHIKDSSSCWLPASAVRCCNWPHSGVRSRSPRPDHPRPRTARARSVGCGPSSFRSCVRRRSGDDHGTALERAVDHLVVDLAGPVERVGLGMDPEAPTA